jgi:hypothetical protein
MSLTETISWKLASIIDLFVKNSPEDHRETFTSIGFLWFREAMFFYFCRVLFDLTILSNKPGHELGKKLIPSYSAISVSSNFIG